MENEIAQVKKYRPITNLLIGIILCVLISGVIFCLYFIVDIFDEDSSVWINFYFWIALVVAGLAFVFMFIGLIWHIYSQIKFNKSTPTHYIKYINKDLININGKSVNTDDILDVSCVKMTMKNQLRNCEFIKNKNVGNVIVKLRSSKISLKRVKDVGDTVKQIKAIINRKK